MRRAGAAYAWIAAPPLLATVACTLTMGSPSDPALYVAAAVAPGLGLCLGALLTAVCRHAGMLARPTAALGDTAR